MTRAIRSLPLLGLRLALTAAFVAIAGLWWASHRWILERHWTDLTGYPPPSGWVIVQNGKAIWGCDDDGYAIGGFNRRATVLWHAWPRATFITVPPSKGSTMLRGPTIALGAGMLLAWCAPFIQSWRRRRAGRCPCGYDLRGLPPDARCPECGAERKMAP